MSTYLREAAAGLFWLAIGVLMWSYLVDELPWNDYALSAGGLVSEGVITGAWEEYADTDTGTIIEFTVTYEFETHDGELVQGRVGPKEGTLRPGIQPGYPTTIEYLSRKPTVNRPELLSGASGWRLWLRLVGSLALLVFCASFGAIRFFDAAKGYWHSPRRSPRSA